MLDVQYLIFARHVAGQSVKSSALSLFIVVFIMVCASLLMLPLLSYLIYKNESKSNKLMNLFLMIAITSGFIFCITFNSYFRDRTLKGVSEVFLGILLLSLILYVGFKNAQRKMYLNLISVLYMENDHRISTTSVKSINTALNFVALS